MLLPGPLLFLAYKWLTGSGYIEALALIVAKKDLSNMVAGFSYTMLGFLATIITILFTFTRSQSLEEYRRNGYLALFFNMYLLAVFSLLVTAFLSLYGFSAAKTPWMFSLLLMSFANNLIQIFIVTVVLCNIARHASQR